MTHSFKIALWNANGLNQHNQEVQLFMSLNDIDIMLISETHFTNASYFKIPNHSVYFTNHPSNRAHGGSAILIKSSIKHYVLPEYQYDCIQGTSIVVEDLNGPLTMCSVYCPPRHNISDLQFSNLFSCLGNKFISGGDCNAKNQL